MTRQIILLSLYCSLWCAGALADAILLPVYDSPLNFSDEAGEGFNSNDPPHALSRANGNPGTTLGEQRRWAFERALEFWGRRLDSNIVIEVATKMDYMSCSSVGALLATAKSMSLISNWTPAAGGSSPPFPDTLYVGSLANKIANKDFDTFYNDIYARFNKGIDESDACLESVTWYYALGEAPSGTISFFKTAVHELAHGLGFSTKVNLASGSKFAGKDDVYMKFLEDHSTGKLWPDMTDSERATSAIDTTDLHWVGPNVLAALGSLSGGVSGGHVQMHAPTTLRQTSSVSHWDVHVGDNNNYNEIMEPVHTGSAKLTVTDELLHDLGWNDIPANNCTFASDRLLLSSVYSGSNTHNACVSITYDGAVIYDGDTSAMAGREMVLKNGFTVELGATFAVETDPNIGL